MTIEVFRKNWCYKQLRSDVIPASEARRESFREDQKDSGQAGMTDKAKTTERLW